MKALGWVVIALAAAAAFVFSLTGDFTALAGLSTGERAALGAGIAIMIVYSIVLLGDYSGRLGQAIKHALAWIAIGMVFIVGYTFRSELTYVANRVGTELMPPGYTWSVGERDQATGQRTVRIRRRMDGHFQARAKVNDAFMTMLVDTGASTVVLRPSDAARAGIDLDALSYTTPVQTANGQAFAATVRLRSLDIGGIVFRNVEAMVGRPGSLNENLLGMSFLRRLEAYEFSKDFLTLKG